MASANLMYETAPKASALGQPRGIGRGKKWEVDSESGGHTYTCSQFMLMYGKNHYNIVIILK